MGTMAEPLHTWLKGVFRNLRTQNAIWVYLKKRVKVNGPKSHCKSTHGTENPDEKKFNATDFASFQYEHRQY